MAFALAGNQNQDFANLQALLAELEMGERIRFLGFVSNQEKVSLIRNSAAMYFASFYEGFGLPILEAQSLAVPVITSNTTSMPEVAGEGAILVDPNDIKDLEEAIARVLQPEASAALIRAGQSNITRFSWEQAAQILLQTFAK
ncbi:glycosyltransferase [bacterium]|nr:MAG: glycosyltransferase [bacterium]